MQDNMAELSRIKPKQKEAPCKLQGAMELMAGFEPATSSLPNYI